MRKIILIACLIIPIAIFGKEPNSQSIIVNQPYVETPTPGDYLESASKNFKLGLISSIGGGTIATAMILIGQGENVTQDAQDELNTVAYVVGAASIIAGTIFTVKGIIDLGKAGKRLNYEVGVTEAKLAFVF